MSTTGLSSGAKRERQGMIIGKSGVPDAWEVDRAQRAMEFEMMEEKLSSFMVDMSKEMPEVQPLISINGCCVCSRGNISAICGEAKSKKTFLTSALVASAMAIPKRA